MGNRKNLKEMSLEELWELFPITLVPYDPRWKEWASEEIGLINGILRDYTARFSGQAVIAGSCQENPAENKGRSGDDSGVESKEAVISHIGSTAIGGIYAKPIIDILVEAPATWNWDTLAEAMEHRGYILMSRSHGRMSFNKGYTPEGYAGRVFHIHFHEPGDNDEILFRDYLSEHREAAKDYERLKLSLLPEFRNNRDGYSDAKSDFVKETVMRAKSMRNR